METNFQEHISLKEGGRKEGKKEGRKLARLILNPKSPTSNIDSLLIIDSQFANIMYTHLVYSVKMIAT